MSCGYCGNNIALCQKSDMYVCEDCYDNIKRDCCCSCDDSLKEDCKIFNSPEMNHKEVKKSIVSFFVENRVSCLEDIYQNEKVAENIYPLFEKLFELTENEVCCELEDLGWI